MATFDLIQSGMPGPDGLIHVTITGNDAEVTGTLAGDADSFPPPSRPLGNLKVTDLATCTAYTGTDPLSGRPVSILVPGNNKNILADVNACLIVPGDLKDPSSSIEQVIPLTGTWLP